VFDIAQFHPQIVHFVVAGLVLAVPLYWIAFLGRPAWIRPTASLLLLVGTLATVAAVKSGMDAHGPAERIPGARPAVVEHEELGERVRNIFLIMLALEFGAVVISGRPRLSEIAAGRATLMESDGDANGSSAARRVPTMIRAVAALVGAFGLFQLYEASEHGGELVYAYAGGVGTRSGEAGDVANLLKAGLYHQSRLDREAGRSEASARLMEEMARRFPGDVEVSLLAVESLLVDRDDPAAALSALDGVTISEADARMGARAGLLRVDALEASGDAEGARAELERLAERYPDNGAVRRRMER